MLGLVGDIPVSWVAISELAETYFFSIYFCNHFFLPVYLAGYPIDNKHSVLLFSLISMPDKLFYLHEYNFQVCYYLVLKFQLQVG